VETKYDSMRGGWCSKEVAFRSGSVETYKEGWGDFRVLLDM
jgi:hypothetical protein